LSFLLFLWAFFLSLRWDFFFFIFEAFEALEDPELLLESEPLDAHDSPLLVVLQGALGDGCLDRVSAMPLSL
jgi:hypothetical protein